MSQPLHSDVATDIFNHLNKRRGHTQLDFNTEKRPLTEWHLMVIGERNRETFIHNRLKNHKREDFPIVKGILDFLRKRKGGTPRYTREVIDKLKDSNRCEVRLPVLRAGYDLYSEEKYLKEAERDRAKTIRDWAERVFLLVFSERYGYRGNV